MFFISDPKNPLGGMEWTLLRLLLKDMETLDYQKLKWGLKAGQACDCIMVIL